MTKKYLNVLIPCSVALAAILSSSGTARAKDETRTVKDIYAIDHVSIKTFSDQQTNPDPSLKALWSELLDCGFSWKGSLCLDSKFKPNTQRLPLKEFHPPHPMWGTFLQYVPFQSVSTGKTYFFVLQIPKSMKYPINSGFLANEPLPYPGVRYAKAQIATAEDELKTLYAAPNIRSLYHGAQIMLKTSMLSRSAVALVLNQQKDTILKSSNPVYLYGFLELIRSQLPDARNLAAGIASLLIQIPDYSSQPVVAITLAENGSKDSEVRRRLRALLDSKDIELRGQALSALNKVREIEDEIAMIRHLSDRDKNFVTTLFNVVNAFQLKNEHVFVLSELLGSSSPEVRLKAVSLMAKIPGDQTTDLLLTKLGDPSGEVAEAAMKALETRKLRDSNIARLEALLLSPHSHARLAALTELGRIDSPDAKALLISALGDQEQTVSDTAFQGLEKRVLIATDLYPLRRVLTHSSVQTRRHAVELISHIQDANATGALIQQLTDHDATVRHLVQQALENREISPQNVYDLYQLKDNNDAWVREMVAVFLAKIQHPEATTTLIEMFSDPNTNVYHRVMMSMEGRPLNDGQIELLIALLHSSPAPRARSLAAHALSRTKRPYAIEALKEALETEKNPEVLVDIRNALMNAG